MTAPLSCSLPVCAPCRRPVLAALSTTTTRWSRFAEAARRCRLWIRASTTLSTLSFRKARSLMVNVHLGREGQGPGGLQQRLQVSTGSWASRHYPLQHLAVGLESSWIRLSLPSLRRLQVGTSPSRRSFTTPLTSPPTRRRCVVRALVVCATLRQPPVRFGLEHHLFRHENSLSVPTAS